MRSFGFEETRAIRSLRLRRQWSIGRPGDFGFGSAGFGDIFEMFFGNARGATQARRAGPERGTDLRYDIEITLEEAFTGTTREITFDRLGQCATCKGSGAQARNDDRSLRPLRGTGMVRIGAPNAARPDRHAIALYALRWRRSRHAASVRFCARPWTHRNGDASDVTVPAGVDDGSRIRITGNGEGGVRGGPPGDLYVYLTIAPHRLFKREGRDTFVNVPISFSEAALGATIEVPSLARRCRVHSAARNAIRDVAARARIWYAERSGLASRRPSRDRARRRSDETQQTAARPARGVRARQAAMRSKSARSSIG